MQLGNIYKIKYNFTKSKIFVNFSHIENNALGLEEKSILVANKKHYIYKNKITVTA